MLLPQLLLLLWNIQWLTDMNEETCQRACRNKGHCRIEASLIEIKLMTSHLRSCRFLNAARRESSCQRKRWVSWNVLICQVHLALLNSNRSNLTMSLIRRWLLMSSLQTSKDSALPRLYALISLRSLPIHSLWQVCHANGVLLRSCSVSFGLAQSCALSLFQCRLDPTRDVHNESRWNKYPSDPMGLVGALPPSPIQDWRKANPVEEEVYYILLLSS